MTETLKTAAPKGNGRVLGLNIGIASLGWCLLDMDAERIVDMGVRLWDVPQNPKSKESLAAARRGARSVRRNIARRAGRLSHCLELMKEAGLVPADAGKDWMHRVKGDAQPVASRAAALDRRISDRALAQALYSICKRRGYISHAGGDKDKEEGKVLTALAANDQAMKAGGYRTFAEMLVAAGPEGACGVRTRNADGDYSLCVSAPVLADEARQIIEAQREFGNPAMTPDFEEAYLECLRWEKPRDGLDERIYSQVGPCVYFPEEKAAAKACLSFEMCCAWERASNARIVDAAGVESRLPAETRRWCVETLFSTEPIKDNKSCKVTYKALRKRLSLPEGCVFKDAEDESKELYIPKIWRAEREALPAALLERMRADLSFADAIGSALAFASSEKSLRSRLAEADLDLSEGDVDALVSLSFASNAYSGYGTRSARALEMLVGAFEESDEIGSLYDAEKACGLYEARLERPQGVHALPPYTDYDPTCKNPVVLRSMAQLRRTVNAIIRKHGMPETIRIDLARDPKHEKPMKKQMTKAQRIRAAQKAQARAQAAQLMGCAEDEVPGKAVTRLLLHQEQGGVDILTGEPIDDLARLVCDTSYCEICRVLPLSKTFDDSQSNKILVFKRTAREKGTKTPFEHLGEGAAWNAFEERVKAAGLPYQKKQKLLERDLDAKQDGFIARNINDTRYAAKAAVGYLGDYLDFGDSEATGRKEHVQAVRGSLVGLLRREWGFSRKDREADDIHSAVDAAIDAACTRAIVAKVARVSEAFRPVTDACLKKALGGKEPWEGFCADIERRAAGIVPTRRVDHGATGQLYEDSTYSFAGLNEAGTLACLKKAGADYQKSNYVRRPDGSVKLVGKMMMLRLWWDGERYLREPVYYADVAAMRAGTYVPRYFPGFGKGMRSQWPAVPAEMISAGESVELRNGDAVSLCGEIVRYKGFGISTGALKWGSPLKFSEIVIPERSFSSIEEPEDLRRIDEDVLGSCWDGVRISNGRVYEA